MKTSSQKAKTMQGLVVKTTHQKVLVLFLAYPSRRFYGSEIAKLAGISIGQTSKILQDLLKGGVLEKKRTGKAELYRIVTLTPELKLYKTINTILNIKPLLAQLEAVSRLLVLYGSCATGASTEDSDLDLFVVTANRTAVIDAVAGFSPKQRYSYAAIKPVIKSPAEWAALETKDPVFFAELQKGIILFEKGIDEFWSKR